MPRPLIPFTEGRWNIRHTKRDRRCNNDSLQKHQSESTFTGWRHRILRHCSRSTARGHAYIFIIFLDYVLRTSIDKILKNGFKLTKKRSRRYPAKTITDADNADDIAILANTPNQAEALLHSLEQATAGIGLHVNAHRTEYMCFNQATETGRQVHLAIDKLSIIWKSDLTDKMKRSFFQAAVVSILLYGCTTWTLTKRLEKKARRQLHKNAASNIEQVLEPTPNKVPTIRPATSHHEKYKLDEPDMQDTTGEIGTSS